MKSPLYRDIQQWVQNVTSHPQGVHKAAKIEAAGKGTLRGKKIHQIIGRSKQLTAAERVAIYADVYFLRLVDCLRNDFPVLYKLLGDEKFDTLAREFVVEYPSRNYSLNKLGAPMAKFLNKRIPVAQNRAFLVDIARIERAIEEVFDAPEEEALNTDKLLSIKPAQWLAMRLQMSQAVQLFELKYPINDFIETTKTSDDVPPIPKRSKTWLAVYRNDFTVWRLNIEHWQYVLLNAIHNGETLGDAVEQTLQVLPEQNEESIASVQRWFKLAAARSWFVGVRR